MFIYVANISKINTVICHIMMFQSTMNHIYDTGPIKL